MFVSAFAVQLHATTLEGSLLAILISPWVMVALAVMVRNMGIPGLVGLQICCSPMRMIPRSTCRYLVDNIRIDNYIILYIHHVYRICRSTLPKCYIQVTYWKEGCEALWNKASNVSFSLAIGV